MIDRSRAVGALVGLALLVAIALVGVIAVPGLVGADHSFVVLSSSMEPTISTGSVVLVEDVPAERIEEGDVITFRHSQDGGSHRVTHRVETVIEDGSTTQFRTHGDALDNADPWTVPASDVLGTVTVTIPLVGYFINFANSGVGIVALVILPASALAITELYSMASRLGDQS